MTRASPFTALFALVLLVGCGPDDPVDSTTTTDVVVEDCSNGIDDDRDGFGDCTDTDCPDSDNDGFADICDTCPGGRDGSDTDGDGVPDACDPCPQDNPDDTDGDGVCDHSDLCEGDDTQDADGDGVPDDCDICDGVDGADSDGDTVPDDCDLCPSGDDFTDTDGDTVPDDCDRCDGFDDLLDADADSVPDDCDICAGADDLVDTDADTVPDGCDICGAGDDADDADSDGVPDACDACAGSDDLQDADADGMPDDCDICAGGDDFRDTDGDAVPDDCDICLLGDDAIDGDSDTVPDACDLCPGEDDFADADGDGMPDACDTCAGDDMIDDDADGLANDCDNCPADANAGQDDWDLDGIGDVCQPNGCDYVEFSPLRTVPGLVMATPVYIAPRFHMLIDVDGTARDFYHDRPQTPISAVFTLEYHDGSLQTPICTIQWDLSGITPTSNVPQGADLLFGTGQPLTLTDFYEVDLDPAKATSSCPPLPSGFFMNSGLPATDAVAFALERLPVVGIGYGGHSTEWYNQLGQFVGQPMYDDLVRDYSIGMFYQLEGQPEAVEFGEALRFERTCDTIDYTPQVWAPGYVNLHGTPIPYTPGDDLVGPLVAGAVFVTGL